MFEDFQRFATLPETKFTKKPILWLYGCNLFIKTTRFCIIYIIILLTFIENLLRKTIWNHILNTYLLFIQFLYVFYLRYLNILFVANKKCLCLSVFIFHIFVPKASFHLGKKKRIVFFRVTYLFADTIVIIIQTNLCIIAAGTKDTDTNNTSVWNSNLINKSGSAKIYRTIIHI